MEKLVFWLKSEENQRKVLEEVKERVNRIKFKDNFRGKSEKIGSFLKAEI